MSYFQRRKRLVFGLVPKGSCLQSTSSRLSVINDGPEPFHYIGNCGHSDHYSKVLKLDLSTPSGQKCLQTFSNASGLILLLPSVSTIIWRKLARGGEIPRLALPSDAKIPPLTFGLAVHQ
jgi:hypothetical protein